MGDREIGRRLSIDKSLVTRHRVRHVIAPMRHQVAIAGKGNEARVGRQKIAAAAASGAPSTEDIVAAAIGLTAQVTKLAAIESRLERMATIAEAGGSPTGVAVLAAQQMRGIETGSKLAGLPGFVPAKAAEQSAGAPFSVRIIFTSGKTLSITPTPATASPVTIDADLDHKPDFDDDTIAAD